MTIAPVRHPRAVILWCLLGLYATLVWGTQLARIGGPLEPLIVIGGFVLYCLIAYLVVRPNRRSTP